jgi:hypothetical protein
MLYSKIGEKLEEKVGNYKHYIYYLISVDILVFIISTLISTEKKIKKKSKKIKYYVPENVKQNMQQQFGTDDGKDDISTGIPIYKKEVQNNDSDDLIPLYKTSDK